MSHNRLAVITNAIQTAFIDHPTSGPGMTWDQIIRSEGQPTIPANPSTAMAPASMTIKPIP